MHPSPRLSLKLLALPLARRKPSGKPPLFYLHAKKPAQVPIQDLSYASRLTNKAADFWSRLGQADEGTWKRRAYVQGERFMDRIEYEEWSLKAIDPALAPKPWASIVDSVAGKEGETEAKRKVEDKVTLLYPASLLSPGPLLDSLKEQLSHREPHHKSAMWKCLLGAPLTFPFAIIPVVPNFPLFYILWRAWSHWRAWKASAYLNSLLSASQITLTPSASLDTIYSSTPFVPSSVASEAELLLTPDKVPKLVKAFALTEEEGVELNRAVGQVEGRLRTVKEKEEREAKKNA